MVSEDKLHAATSALCSLHSAASILPPAHAAAEELNFPFTPISIRILNGVKRHATNSLSALLSHAHVLHFNSFAEPIRCSCCFASVGYKNHTWTMDKTIRSGDEKSCYFC